MLGVIFGFGGRIGRLQYFLFSTALTILTVALMFAIVFGMLSHGASVASGFDARNRTMLLVSAVLVPAFVWFSLALQAKRIRDIGWQPWLVIPGWMAANLLDGVLVRSGLMHPISPNSGTAFGSLVNLAMVGALLLWPGSEGEEWAPPAQSSGSTVPRRPSPRPSPDPVQTVRAEPVAKPLTFGRRGR